MYKIFNVSYLVLFIMMLLMLIHFVVISEYNLFVSVKACIVQVLATLFIVLIHYIMPLIDKQNHH